MIQPSRQGCACFQVITTDRQGFFSLYRAADTALLATKRVSTETLVTLQQCAPDVYAIATARAVSVWRIRRELPYNVFRGGHSAAVISLYACSGGLVCFHIFYTLSLEASEQEKAVIIRYSTPIIYTAHELVMIPGVHAKILKRD